jgi:hypothetical protein
MKSSNFRRIKSSIRDLARTWAATYEIVTKYRLVSSISTVGGRLVADVQTPGGALFVHLLDLGVAVLPIPARRMRRRKPPSCSARLDWG